jgi:uncharacterized protein
MPLDTHADFSSVINRDDINLRQFIIELLASPACPPYTMNIDQLDGYLHAVAVEPKATEAKDWMPLVFGGEFPDFIDGYSTESITNALIWLYNSHRVQVLNNECDFLFTCKYSPDRSERLRAEQWARGFMQGYIFWQDVWSQYLDEKQTSSNLAVILPLTTNDEIDDILVTLSAVADADYAFQSGTNLESLSLMFNRLPEKVIEYGRIAHIIRMNGKSDVKASERAVAEA